MNNPKANSLRGHNLTLVENAQLKLSTFKFPRGEDVAIYRKEDILRCIDDNIIDKETAYAVVKQCEIDAATFLRNGRWTGIPFIGNIRVPKLRALEDSQEIRQLKEEANKELSGAEYVLFKRNLRASLSNKIKNERYHKYMLSQMITKAHGFFRYYMRKKGDVYAKALLVCCQEFTPMYNLDYKEWLETNCQ